MSAKDARSAAPPSGTSRASLGPRVWKDAAFARVDWGGLNVRTLRSAFYFSLGHTF